MLRLTLILSLLAAPVLAQDPGAAAREAARALEEASEQLDRAESARDRVRALTTTVKAYEAGLAAMRDGLRHAAVCRAPSHMECPTFRRILRAAGTGAIAAPDRKAPRKRAAQSSSKEASSRQ